MVYYHHLWNLYILIEEYKNQGFVFGIYFKIQYLFVFVLNVHLLHICTLFYPLLPSLNILSSFRLKLNQ